MISTKNGRSKKEAKNMASLEVLRRLVEGDHFAESSLKMILYKGKFHCLIYFLLNSVLILDKGIKMYRSAENKNQLDNKEEPPVVEKV